MCACKKKHCDHHSEFSKKSGVPARRPLGASQTGESAVEDDHTFRVAIPLAGEVLCSQFANWEQFAVLSVEDGEIEGKALFTPPFHETEILPRWLDNLEVSLLIAGVMSKRALALFARRNIDVITGAPSLPPEDLVQQYLTGTLATEAIVCDDPDQDLPHDASDWDKGKDDAEE